MVRFSRRVNKNLGPFFTAWGVPTSNSARQSIANLPAWMPAELSDVLAKRVFPQSVALCFLSYADGANLTLDRCYLRCYSTDQRHLLARSVSRDSAVVPFPPQEERGQRRNHGKVAKPNHDSWTHRAAPQVTTIQRKVGAVRVGQRRKFNQLL
jgi:hypothetical protein